MSEVALDGDSKQEFLPIMQGVSYGSVITADFIFG